jgi:hypothetical protein
VALQVSDEVEEPTRSTERASRTETIEELVDGDLSPRYRIRSDDGHESVYTPSTPWGCPRWLPMCTHVRWATIEARMIEARPVESCSASRRCGRRDDALGVARDVATALPESVSRRYP